MATAVNEKKKSIDLKDGISALSQRVGRFVVEHANELGVDELLDAISARSDEDALVSLIGTIGTSEEIRRANPLVGARIRTINIKRGLVKKSGGAMTMDQVTGILSISRQAVEKRVAKGTLIDIRSGGTRMFPAFQFTTEGTVPGLKNVLRALPAMGSWMKLSFLLDAAEGEPTIMDLIQDGKTGKAVAIARNFGEQGAG